MVCEPDRGERFSSEFQSGFMRSVLVLGGGLSSLSDSDQSPTSMKLCPDAGATLEETRSSSEQVTGETVSYSVCEGPGSLLKFGGSSLDR